MERIADTTVAFDSVRLRIWQSTVPFRFILEDSTIRGLELNVPRLTYLVHAFAKLRHYFQLLENHNIVLTSKAGQIVPHHLPAGLLYDFYAQQSRDPRREFVEGQVTLIISTTLPSPYNTPQTSEDVVADVWNSVKQNEVLRRGSIRRIQNLTAAQSESFKESFLSLRMATYSSTSESFLNTNGLRHLSVRLYLTPHHAVQDLIPTKMEEGHAPATVAHMMRKLAPETSRLGHERVLVLLHGVVVPWTTSLLELLQEAAYIDGWLYFTLKPALSPSKTVVEGQKESKDDVHVPS